MTGDEMYSTQMPNFLTKDGKLYSFEGSSYADHPPMLLNDGRVVSFENINSVCIDRIHSNHDKGQCESV